MKSTDAEYLTRDERKTLTELLYARRYFPDEYAALLAELEAATGLHGIDEFFQPEYLAGLDGWGWGKLKKKIKRALKVLNPVYQVSRALPKSTRNKLSDWEQKHRKDLKAAAAVAGMFVGVPSAPQFLVNGVKAAGLKVAEIGVSASHAVGALASKLGLPVAGDFLAKMKDKIITEHPGAKGLSDVFAQEMGGMVDKIGRAKIDEIVSKYVGGGQIIDPADPRLTGIANDILAAYGQAQNNEQGGAPNIGGGGGYVAPPVDGAADMANEMMLESEQQDVGASSGVTWWPWLLLGGAVVLMGR